MAIDLEYQQASDEISAYIDGLTGGMLAAVEADPKARPAKLYINRLMKTKAWSIWKDTLEFTPQEPIFIDQAKTVKVGASDVTVQEFSEGPNDAIVASLLTIKAGDHILSRGIKFDSPPGFAQKEISFVHKPKVGESVKITLTKDDGELRLTINGREVKGYVAGGVIADAVDAVRAEEAAERTAKANIRASTIALEVTKAADGRAEKFTVTVDPTKKVELDEYASNLKTLKVKTAIAYVADPADPTDPTKGTHTLTIAGTEAKEAETLLAGLGVATNAAPVPPPSPVVKSTSAPVAVVKMVKREDLPQHNFFQGPMWSARVDMQHDQSTGALKEIWFKGLSFKYEPHRNIDTGETLVYKLTGPQPLRYGNKTYQYVNGEGVILDNDLKPVGQKTGVWGVDGLSNTGRAAAQKPLLGVSAFLGGDSVGSGKDYKFGNHGILQAAMFIIGAALIKSQGMALVGIGSSLLASPLLPVIATVAALTVLGMTGQDRDKNPLPSLLGPKGVTMAGLALAAVTLSPPLAATAAIASVVAGNRMSWTDKVTQQKAEKAAAPATKAP